MKETPPAAPWYARAFGSAYLSVYPRRTPEAAASEARFALEVLDLGPGARVLDLCCGPGFHLEALRNLGAAALGVDLSPELLAQARKRGPVARGDMRHLPFRGPFRGVLSFFTTFGYFREDRENARVLEEVARLLPPGGGFFLDYLNPSRVRADLVPRSRRTSGETVIVETRWIEENPPRVRKRVEIISPGGKGSITYTESVRLYPLDEMMDLMASRGLPVEAVYGDFRGASFGEDSPRMILLARRAGNQRKE